MRKIYYTAKEGRRNSNGHTTTRGTVYAIFGFSENPELVNIGEYVHQSGGAGIEMSILEVAKKFGVDVGGGYYKDYREFVEINEI